MLAESLALELDEFSNALLREARRQLSGGGGRVQQFARCAEVELPVLDNDVDPDGETLVVGGTEGGGDGVRVEDGALIATFAEAGVYVFTYDACDPSGLCATARVTMVSKKSMVSTRACGCWSST